MTLFMPAEPAHTAEHEGSRLPPSTKQRATSSRAAITCRAFGLALSMGLLLGPYTSLHAEEALKGLPTTIEEMRAAVRTGHLEDLPATAAGNSASAAGNGSSNQARIEMLFDDGSGVDITFSEAMISFIPEAEIDNRSTMESITLAIMNNPEMADVFVSGLFAPPAAGGPEYNQSQQAEIAEEDLAAYDPNRIAQLETSLAAAILFGQLTQVQIIPDFRPPNIEGQVYNTTPR